MLDTIESAHTRFIDGVSMAEWLGSNKAPLLSIYISWRLLRLFARVLSSERRGLDSASIISEGEWVGPAVVVFIVVVADDGGLVALISHI